MCATTNVTENKGNDFEVWTYHVSCPLSLSLLNIQTVTANMSNTL